jgi:hypothetical protein
MQSEAFDVHCIKEKIKLLPTRKDIVEYIEECYAHEDVLSIDSIKYLIDYTLEQSLYTHCINFIFIFVCIDYNDTCNNFKYLQKSGLMSVKKYPKHFLRDLAKALLTYTNTIHKYECEVFIVLGVVSDIIFLIC